MTDFNKLALAVDKPFRVLLRRPDDKPLVDAAGKQAFVDVVSADSRKAKDIASGILARRQRGEQITNREAQVETIAGLTTGWYLLCPNGEPLCGADNVPIEFSVENAKIVYAVEGADYIFEQVVAGAYSRVNFMPR